MPQRQKSMASEALCTGGPLIALSYLGRWSALCFRDCCRLRVPAGNLNTGVIGSLHAGAGGPATPRLQSGIPNHLRRESHQGLRASASPAFCGALPNSTLKLALAHLQGAAALPS